MSGYRSFAMTKARRHASFINNGARKSSTTKSNHGPRNADISCHRKRERRDVLLRVKRKSKRSAKDSPLTFAFCTPETRAAPGSAWQERPPEGSARRNHGYSCSGNLARRRTSLRCRKPKPQRFSQLACWMIRQPRGTVRARRPLALLTFPGSRSFR